MPIQTTNPVNIAEPDKPYSDLGISMAISPLWQSNYVGASVSISLTPYRTLADGTIEKSTDVRTVNIADAYVDAQTDTDLAAAVTSIYTALATYIAAKGL